MGMKVNYDKLNTEAIRKKISVHLLIKRKYHYRRFVNDKKNCYFCCNVGYQNYNDGCGNRMQCSFVGESRHDRHADVSIFYICDAFNEKINI